MGLGKMDAQLLSCAEDQSCSVAQDQYLEADHY